MEILGVVILVFFYSVYLGKMVIQRKKGIQTDQIAKRKKKDKQFYIELIMKFATYSVVLVESISIFVIEPRLPQILIVFGIFLGIVGDFIFMISVVTMKDSWRAGLAEDDKTEMITSGIYQISRNPAFLGFDCVYLGILLMFFNIPLLIFSVFAMVMLHIQILQEEQYLTNVFKDDYINYKIKYIDTWEENKGGFYEKVCNFNDVICLCFYVDRMFTYKNFYD